MSTDPPNRKNPLQDYAKFSGLAFQMLGIILLGSYAGVKLDEHFHIQAHVFTIVLLFLSVLAAIWLVIKKI